MERLKRAVREYIGDERPFVVGPELTVLNVISGMEAADAHCAVVMAGERIVGIFTERDFVTRVLARGRLPADVRVGEVMSQGVEVLGSGDDIAYAINLMAVGGFRNIPVVDEGGALCGVIDVGDVTSQLAEILDHDEDDAGGGREWLDIGGDG